MNPAAGRIEVPDQTEGRVAREASGIGAMPVTDAITGELRALAGPELYRRNAFRISGLQATVDRRTTRQVVQRLSAALQVGADVDLGPDASSDPVEIQAACDLILGDPRRRLVHEVFAPWGDDVSKCGCPLATHQLHDAAVHKHAAAIERELTGGGDALELRDRRWDAAGEAWKELLDGSGFWDHLDFRVSELDDRQLDLSASDLIEDELPRTLLKPVVDLVVANPRPARLAANARRWPAPEPMIDLMLEAAASPLYDELEERRIAVTRQSRESSAETIAPEIERDLVPKLQVLEAIVPAGRHHRTGHLHDQFALLLNNAAVELIDRRQVTDGRAEKWLTAAAKLVKDPRERDLIKTNLETLRTNMQVGALLGTGRQSPGYSLDRTYYYSPYRRRRRWPRVLFWLLVIAAIVYGVTRCGPWGAVTASLYSAKIADNAPVGTCLAKQTDWAAKPGEVRLADCDDNHWAEVLAYVPITGVPALYPGADQANALARFQCEEARERQEMPANTFVTEFVVAPAEHWNDGKNQTSYENYASCIVRRADGESISAGQEVNKDVAAAATVVRMNVFSTDVAANAPIGLCIQQEGRTGNDEVPVVRCESRHWAQVFGYPVIFKPGEKWPGDDAVYAKAKKACAKLIPRLPGYTTRVGWPDRSWWNDPKRAVYTYCLVHRADNQLTVGKIG